MALDPHSPEVLGPIAWKQIHDACSILESDCECRAECEQLGIAMHDLVNIKLGKPIQDQANLRMVAKRYQKAVADCPGGVCN